MSPLGRLVKSLANLLAGGEGRPPVRGGVAHGPSGIRQVGHREYVGGDWDRIGKLQFDYLVEHGLAPHHYLLDIACGSLRGGVYFIPYLDAGRYLGIDKEAELIRAGVTQELGQELYKQKQPRFVVSDRFDFERLNAQPDFALAQSLFTHLPATDIEACLRRLRPVMAKGGVFFATFFESRQECRNPAVAHDHGYFAYTRRQMTDFGLRNNWGVEYAGDWGHPRQQVMVRYHLE